MADCRKYLPDDFKITDSEKEYMDIFAGAWEYCHETDCEDCPNRQGLEKTSILTCLSYQYAKRLIKAFPKTESDK